MEGFTKVRAGLVLACLVICSGAVAQTFVTPSTNTNVVGVTPNPDDYIADYGMKQQQEPSCIIRPSNKKFVFCAYNDMRASDLVDVQNDSWIGVSQSADGGNTWFSRLSPGFKSHPNSLDMGFAADPSVVAIPGNSPGLAILNYIGGFRDSNDGVLAIQRWVEMPREDVDFWKPEDGIQIVADGSSGRFIDKPAFLYLVDPVLQQGSMTQQINVEGEPAPITVTTPTGTLFVAYAVFTGSNSVKVILQYSTDNGLTWSRKIRLSEDQNEVTGVSLAAINGNVVAVWRRKADNNNSDAIMSAYCSQGGTKCAKATEMFQVCPFDQPATGSSPRTFTFPWAASTGDRVWAFATDRRFAGDSSCTPLPSPAPPGTYSGKPRIVGMSSADGKNWVGASIDPDLPFVVDKNLVGSDYLGYQFMPSATGTKGRIDLAWYDTRREEPLPPGNTLPDGTPLPLVNDYVDSTGLARVFRKADVYMTRLVAGADCNSGGPNSGCTPDVQQSVRVSRFPFLLSSSNVVLPGDFSDIEQVGQEVKAHKTGLRLYASGTLAFKGDYIAVANRPLRQIEGASGGLGPWISNFEPQGAQGPELPTFSAKEDILVAWGDNRDVIENSFITDPDSDTQLPYTPTTNSTVGLRMLEQPLVDPESVQQMERLADTNEVDALAVPEIEVELSLKSASEPDDDPDKLPDTAFGMCGPLNDFSLSRDSNVYASLVVDEPSLTASITTKPLSTLQRMYPVQMNNPELTAQEYCLVIEDQPTDAPIAGRASFWQLPATGPFANPDGTPNYAGLKTELDVFVPANSSVSRAVFVVTADEDTLIPVSAYDGTCTAPGAKRSTVLLRNGELLDPGFCAVPIPDDRLDACQLIADDETHNIQLLSPNLQAPILQAPNFQAPNLQAPNFQAPILQAPNFQAPNFQAPNLQAPILQAPNFQAETLLAPNLQAPNFQAPNFQAPNLQAAALDGDPATEVYYQDVTFVVSALANTTTTYSADIGLNDLDTDETFVQLIAWTPNVYATSRNCVTMPIADNQVIAAVDLGVDDLQSVNLPTAFSADDQDPYAGAVTFTGVPGQNIAVTARIWASGDTLKDLRDLHALYAQCVIDNGAEACADAGVGSLITFGASSHGCSTNRLNTDPSEDCLDTGAEKIFVDRLPPILNLPGDFSVEATGMTTLVNYAASATDGNDGDVGITCVPASGSLFGLGANTVSCDAADAAGNPANGSFTITVVDTTAPDLAVPDDLTGEFAVEAEGTLTTVAFGTATAFDVFDGIILPTSDAPPAGFPVGTTEVTWTAMDGQGNTATASQFVTVEDTTAPTFDLNPLPARGPFDATSDLGYGDNYPLPTASDAVDTSVLVACLPAPGSTFPLGDTAVSCTATDDYDNTSAASLFIVSVTDQTAPEIFAPTSVVVLAAGSGSDEAYSPDAGGNFTVEANLAPPDGATISYAPTASDAVNANPLITCTPASGSTFPEGTTSVQCSASDGVNTSSIVGFSILVEDTTDPVFNVEDDTIYTFEADTAGGAYVDLVGDRGLIATDRGVTIYPTCEAMPVGGGATIPLPALLAPGDYSVVCSVDGVTTTTISVTVSVDINDQVPPVLTIPGDGTATVQADETTGTAVVNVYGPIFDTDGDGIGDTAISATDIVDTSVDINCIPGSGTFSVGSHTITCTASDDGPNADGQPNTSDPQTFTLIVADITPPTLVVPTRGDPSAPADIIEEATSPDGAVVTYSIITSDNADPSPSLVCVPASGSIFGFGTTTVTCTSTDVSSNSATANFEILVQDTTGPGIIPPPDVTTEATGAQTIVALGTATADDDGDADVTITNDAPAAFPVGINTVTWTATDDSGNSSSTTQTVTIVDTTPPTINASDITIQRTDNFDLTPKPVVEVNYISGVTVNDSVDPDPTLSCAIDNPGSNVIDEPLTGTAQVSAYGTWQVTCTAVDSAVPANTATTTFDINVVFQYGIDLILPKGQTRAGSTLPIDWSYLDQFGNPVPADGIDPSVSWIGPYAGNDCSGSTDNIGGGEDSGSSSIRFSSDSMLFQFSWQTPSMPGRYILVISPPGVDLPDPVPQDFELPDSAACVNLR